MEIDEAINITQDHLADEGGTMGDLLDKFRDRVSPALIGETEWAQILARAGTLPITMAALPFGFEIPLHDPSPRADLGVSLASGTRTATFFEDRARNDRADGTAKAIMRLFSQIDADESELQEIVGRKLMLEYDIGSAEESDSSIPGMFLRPGERPIIGKTNQVNDVNLVVDALVSAVDWKANENERINVQRTYLAQPANTRMDSFGVFPSRARSVRLAIMGFESQCEICKYLENIDWPGDVTAIDDTISRFQKRVSIARTGANIDVQEDGVGPTLGLTLIVKQRYTKDSRYWLDGLTDWNPFLDALGHEELVSQDKLKELASWVSKPTMLFAKSGRYVMLRGIHHIKLVVEENRLTKVKAYVFMVLSAALST